MRLALPSSTRRSGFLRFECLSRNRDEEVRRDALLIGRGRYSVGEAPESLRKVWLQRRPVREVWIEPTDRNTGILPPNDEFSSTDGGQLRSLLHNRRDKLTKNGGAWFARWSLVSLRKDWRAYMNLATNYLGFHLRSPIVPSACPLTERLDNVRRLEDAGAGAIVFHSLFEEQLQPERRQIFSRIEPGIEIASESVAYSVPLQSFSVEPENYLEHLRRAKASVRVPIIASLNAQAEGGWIEFAKSIGQTGADALELNLYSVPADPNQTGAEIETNYLRIVAAVKANVQMPIAVKLSPFFTSFSNVARKLVQQGGADALVLFNRFYQPDFCPETFETAPNALLSTSAETLLPLRWIAMLHGNIQADLAATGGVSNAIDIVKLLMAGANVTMVCSALLRRGISYLTTLEGDLSAWLEKHGYESVSQIQGCMSQRKCPDPAAFERAQYVQAVTSLPSKYSGK